MQPNCDNCGTPLAAGAQFCSKCGAPATGDDPTHVPGGIGELLENNWRLERKIGEGGMGTVYLAHDLALDRKVAIKLLSGALVHDSELVGRFEREAKMTAALDHPNIVPVYAVGRTEGRPFMVMKYLEGNSLSAHLRTRGTIARDELLSIVRQVAAGLDFIHARGFIHRDIKTGNIFIGPTGTATILDFGILRPSRNAEAITRTGMVMGTPQYMSPEQAMGIRDIDHRADLYALAVVIFECLCGSLPFEGDSDLKIVQMQAHSPPPDVRSRANWLPPDVSTVMLRALAKRPEDRFPSCSDLYLALEAAFGVRFMTGPGGVPVLEGAVAPKPAPGVVPYPIPLGASVAPGGSGSFPIPLEPTPPAPGERRELDQRTRPSRPSAVVQSPGQSNTQAPTRQDSKPLPTPEVDRDELPPAPKRGKALAFTGIGAVVLLTGAAAAWFAIGARPAVEPELPPVADSAAQAPTSTPADTVVASGSADPGDTVTAVAVVPAQATDAAADAGDAVVASEADAEDLAPLDPGPDAKTAEKPPEVRRPTVSKSSLGKVNVITTFKGGPYWASILVNGERKGTTPALLELPVGKHTLRLERAGFRPIEKQIKVASGRPAVVRIELIP